MRPTVKTKYKHCPAVDGLPQRVVADLGANIKTVSASNQHTDGKVQDLASLEEKARGLGQYAYIY